MPAKQSNLDKVLQGIFKAILVVQTLAPEASGKKKKKDVLTRAIEAAKLGGGVFLTPKQNQAVGLVIDAGVAAFKVAEVFRKDEVPGK